MQITESSLHLLSMTFVDTMPPWIKNQFFYPESERVRLTTHDYGVDDNVRIMRDMTNLKLVDCYEHPLKNLSIGKKPLNMLVKWHSLTI